MDEFSRLRPPAEQWRGGATSQTGSPDGHWLLIECE
jgi:hypothetical protein